MYMYILNNNIIQLAYPRSELHAPAPPARCGQFAILLDGERTRAGACGLARAHASIAWAKRVALASCHGRPLFLKYYLMISVNCSDVAYCDWSNWKPLLQMRLRVVRSGSAFSVPRLDQTHGMAVPDASIVTLTESSMHGARGHSYSLGHLWSLSLFGPGSCRWDVW